MYIRKDIHKSLRLEAKMAEDAKCFSWAKLFRECSYLLRQKDRDSDRFRAQKAELVAALREIASHKRGGHLDTAEKLERDLMIGYARAALASIKTPTASAAESNDD